MVPDICDPCDDKSADWRDGYAEGVSDGVSKGRIQGVLALLTVAALLATAFALGALLG